MTDRLYYRDSALCEFDAVVTNILPPASNGRMQVVLDRTAFYPTSGGQIFDRGWLASESGARMGVSEVAESEDGRIVHYLETPAKLTAGDKIKGSIDRERRSDHMQQHTGQHVLSAAFIELYQMPTVSFHMGDDYCTIDLATDSIDAKQVVGTEKRANEIVFENRPIRIRFVSRQEAENLGLRKLPPADREELRLIEIADFDVSACGGTHVNATGQVGSILVRKVERAKQGMRVEFVCGQRAVRTARRDYGALSEAASLFSTGVWDVPSQVRKSLEDAKTLRRLKDDALEELAASMASEAVQREPQTSDRKVIVRTFSDRDINFAKLFAQRVARTGVPAVALVASTIAPPGIVFAQAAGGTADLGALLKQVLLSVGGRGGGSRDFAQGGVPTDANVEQLLQLAADTIKR